MPDEPRERADARLEEALEASAWSDPRPLYRARLRALREHAPEAFQRAIRHYEDELIPALAGGGAEPVEAWLGYGRLLAELVPGRLVEIAADGAAREVAATKPWSGLVLHLPDEPRIPAMAVAQPRQPSAAQQATFALLVEGRRSLPA